MLYPGTRIGGWCIDLELSGMESEKEIRFVFLEIDLSRKYLPLWAFLKIHSFSRRKTIWRWRSLLLQKVFIPKPATMPLAEKALKSIIIDLGELPPKPMLWIVWRECCPNLGCIPLDLEDLKLNFLSRMHTSTRYPSEDLSPVQLFDQSDGEECLEIAEKVINFTRTMKKGDV